MEIVNQEYKFSFIIPDEYHEIPKGDYLYYHIDSSTLHVFTKMDDLGIPQTISINRDEEANNEEEYLKLVDLNLENLAKIGMLVEEHIHHRNKRARIDIVYCSFRGLKFVTYFTTIHRIVIASSINIKEINDEDDNTLAALFESIVEL